jgi:hypothetical protein
MLSSAPAASRLTLGMYDTPKLAACMYDAAAWRFRCPRCDLNFPEVESLEEAKFLTPPPRLLTDDERHRHRHRETQRRLTIAECDECLMQQWREQVPGGRSEVNLDILKNIFIVALVLSSLL